MRRGPLLVGALLCVAAGPVRVLATEAGDVALEYRVPVGACPDEKVFRERTADLFDFVDPFVAAGRAATTNIRVEITRESSGYRGVVTVYDPANGDSVRSSSEEHRDCDSLVWVLSHRMGLIVQKPKFVIPPGKQAPAPAQDAVTSRRLDALEEAVEDQQGMNKDLYARIAALQKALDEEKKRKMDLTYALSAGALITANLTNNVGPGVWAGGELRTGPIGLGLELRTILPSRLAATPSLDFDLSQYVALLTPCGRYSYFFGCGVAGAGAQLSYDSNFPGGSKSDVAPLIQLGARLGVEVPFGETRFAGRAWGEVLYSTPPTGINYKKDGVNYPVSRPDVSAFFGVGVVVRFGQEGT